MKIKQIGIRNLFSDMSTFLKNKVKSEIVYRSLSKQDMVDLINDNINIHTAFLSPISALNKEERITLFRGIQKSPNISKYPYMIEVRKNITGRAHKLETETPFESIISTNKALMNMNKNLLKNIDKIIEEKEIVVFDIRLSNYAFLGILSQSELYGLYSQYLLDLCMTLMSKSDSIPAYRTQFLKDNLKIFVKMTNDVINTSSYSNFFKDIDIIKKKGIDFKIKPIDQQMDISSVAKIRDFPFSILNPLSMLPSVFNIFKLIGETFIEYRHDRNEKIKVTKEWLETRVALLKLELTEYDKNDIEYINLEKIVSKYEDMITKQDQKLSNYSKD